MRKLLFRTEGFNEYGHYVVTEQYDDGSIETSIDGVNDEQGVVELEGVGQATKLVGLLPDEEESDEAEEPVDNSTNEVVTEVITPVEDDDLERAAAELGIELTSKDEPPAPPAPTKRRSGGRPKKDT